MSTVTARTVQTKKRGPSSAARFDDGTITRLLDDLQSKRIPLDRITVSDDTVPGLRVIVRNSGSASFHIQYRHGESRPMMKLGDFPAMKVEAARHLARTVNALAENGIDVQEGLHERLIRELKEKGVKWRP